MKSIHRCAAIVSLLVTCVVCATARAPVAEGQNTPASAAGNTVAPPSLLRQMVGTWGVRQRMWPGPGAAAIDLPPAIAHRRLIGGAFLEEMMTLAPGSTREPFTRVAYFNYNAVNQQYEYVSIDTRAPQIMVEKSYDTTTHGLTRDRADLPLYGGSFVAPRWGNFTNAGFRYRLTVGNIEDNRQVVRLYLTPQSGADAKEFLAFEYLYTRQQ